MDSLSKHLFKNNSGIISGIILMMLASSQGQAVGLKDRAKLVSGDIDTGKSKMLTRKIDTTKYNGKISARFNEQIKTRILDSLNQAVGESSNNFSFVNTATTSLKPEPIKDILGPPDSYGTPYSVEMNAYYSNGIEPEAGYMLTSNEENMSHEVMGKYDLTGPEQHYVLRHVCCNDLPIIADPNLPSAQLFAEANIVATPNQNEVVAVFDDLPVYNGEQLFVRVQRSGGQHYTGWFPLFWLHEISSPTTTVNVDTGVSYKAISKVLRNTVNEIFYANCGDMHPDGGESGFNFPGDLGSNYECGEYPVGNTSYIRNVNGESFRFLGKPTMNMNAYTSPQQSEPLHHLKFGYYENPVHNNISLSTPFYIGPLSTQTRGEDEYGIQSLDDPDTTFLTRTYWSSVSAQNDEAVRIHPMDWYFKTWFDDDAGNHTEEVNFSLLVNLPGFDMYSPIFDKNIVLWYTDMNGFKSEAVIHNIGLGGMRISEVPLRVNGKVKLKIQDESSSAQGGVIDSYTIDSKDQISIEFTDVKFTREPEIEFYDGVSIIYQSFGDVTNINYVMNYFETVLDAILFSEDSGSYFWEVASDKVLASLLDTLDELKPRLAKTFESPKALVRDGCSAVMPDSYKTMNSPFYAFYKNCRDFAATVQNQGFVNNSNDIQDQYGFTASPQYWANINLAGLGWLSPEDNSIFYPCTGEPDCVESFMRPWWSRYNPQYAYTNNGSKFNPSSYNYISSIGGKILYRADGDTVKHYSHFLRCLIPTADRELNKHPDPDSLDSLVATTQATCRLPALETACALYGEGNDLEDQWEARWGYTPPLSGYAQYCAWAEELRNESDEYGLQVE